MAAQANTRMSQATMAGKVIGIMVRVPAAPSAFKESCKSNCCKRRDDNGEITRQGMGMHGIDKNGVRPARPVIRFVENRLGIGRQRRSQRLEPTSAEPCNHAA